MSDLFPEGTGCLIAIYVGFCIAIVAGISLGIGYLIWGH